MFRTMFVLNLFEVFEVLGEVKEKFHREMGALYIHQKIRNQLIGR